MDKLAEMVSLFLTWPTIILALTLLSIWGKTAWKSWKIPSKERTSQQWFVLGVAVGFLGALVDNSYWGVAWSLEYIHSEHAETAFGHGVYFNIPFRQLAGIYAAYCHIKAYVCDEPVKSMQLKIMLALSSLFGLLYLIFLELT